MSFTKLRYHVVFATKKRQRLLSGSVKKFCLRAFDEHSREVGAYLLARGGVEDHVHLVPAIPPTMAVSDYVKRVKRRTTISIKREYPRIGHFAWQRGYGAFTLSPFEMTEVIAYVRTQEQRHARSELWEDFERLTGS